jgi:hypothetical protein
LNKQKSLVCPTMIWCRTTFLFFFFSEICSLSCASGLALSHNHGLPFVIWEPIFPKIALVFLPEHGSSKFVRIFGKCQTIWRHISADKSSSSQQLGISKPKVAPRQRYFLSYCIWVTNNTRPV